MKNFVVVEEKKGKGVYYDCNYYKYMIKYYMEWIIDKFFSFISERFLCIG